MRPLLLALLLLFQHQAGAETLRLTNGEWPPYLGEKLPYQGIASRIVVEAFALQGIDVVWEFHPWARSLELAESGHRDGTAVWMYSDERAAKFFISDTVVETSYHLFHRKKYLFDWKQIADLQKHRVVATRGYDYGETFQQAEANGQLRISRVTSDETAIRQILAGRADVFPVVKVVGFDVLHQHFSTAERAQLTFHPKVLHSNTMHLLLSRSTPGAADLIRRFNQGLAQLKAQGKLSKHLREVAPP
jgi:polar amino acid transport system substrate-binding protein